MSEPATPRLLNRPESYPPEHLKVTHTNTRKLPTRTQESYPPEHMKVTQVTVAEPKRIN